VRGATLLLRDITGSSATQPRGRNPRLRSRIFRELRAASGLALRLLSGLNVSSVIVPWYATGPRAIIKAALKQREQSYRPALEQGELLALVKAAFAGVSAEQPRPRLELMPA
jgi:hypothetical protein